MDLVDSLTTVTQNLGWSSQKMIKSYNLYYINNIWYKLYGKTFYFFFWKSFKEQIADMYEKVTEVLKRQYTYFENVNLFYNGNWLSILSTVQRRADTRIRYLSMSEVCGHDRVRTRVHVCSSLLLSIDHRPNDTAHV